MSPTLVDIHIHDQLQQKALNEHRCHAALRRISRQAGWERAEFSVAIVSDADMARIHGKFLNQPTSTDVMSFVLEQQDDRMEGELIINGEMAARAAAEIGWRAEDELLWYIVHGALHLAGWEDTTPAQRQAMFLEQARILQAVGYEPELAMRGMGQSNAASAG